MVIAAVMTFIEVLLVVRRTCITRCTSFNWVSSASRWAVARLTSATQCTGVNWSTICSYNSGPTTGAIIFNHDLIKNKKINNSKDHIYYCLISESSKNI